MAGGVDSIGYDPKFLEAYNYNPAVASDTATESADTANKQSESIMQQAVTNPTTEKSGNGKAIITGAAITSAAALIAVATHKGSGKGVKKTLDGFKVLFEGAKSKLGFTKKVSSNAPKDFTIRTVDGKTVCTMPGHLNKVGGKGVAEADIVKELENLGYKNVANLPKDLTTVFVDADGKAVVKLADGIKLNHYEFVHEGVTYTVKSGKVVKITGTNALKLEQFNNPLSENKELVDAVKKKIEGFEKGENINDLSNIKLTHKQDGLTRIFTLSKASETPKLTGAISDRYSVESTKIKAYLDKNEAADKVVKSFTEGKFDDLSIASAELTAKLDGKDCTFFIENGEITAIKIDGAIHKKGSNDFAALHHDYPTDFENALKNTHSFENVVYK